MEFNLELLARLEAAQLGSPSVLHTTSGATHAAAAAAGSSRRALWPSELRQPGSSPGSSGRQTPRSCGLLEALYTSDGSPRADETARAAAAAARAATAPPPAVAGHLAGCWSELPADCWRWVVLGLTPSDVKSARLVCADWHAALSSNVYLLRPRQLRCKLAAQRRVRGVGWWGWATCTLQGCIVTLAHSAAVSPHAPPPCAPCSFPSLQVLELSQCRRLQDWELREVCLLGTLRCVSLRGCEGVTDEGVAALAGLPRLARLVLRCVFLFLFLFFPCLPTAGGSGAGSVPQQLLPA